MRIEGEIAVGEAARYAGKACSRLNGHPKPMIAGNAVSAIATIGFVILFSTLQSLFNLPGWLWMPALLVAVAAGIAICIRVHRGWSIRIARTAFATRGLVNPVPSSFAISESGFSSTTGRVTLQAPWSAVSDLFRVGPYWVVLLEGYPQYMPRRFFASSADEKAFLSGILAHMSPEAKGRSCEAEGFVRD